MGTTLRRRSGRRIRAVPAPALREARNGAAGPRGCAAGPRMPAEADRFVLALTRDLIDADDFAH
jgi:hypothetical protein